eukprot:3232966-Prymnesium_polylepis.1
MFFTSEKTRSLAAEFGVRPNVMRAASAHARARSGARGGASISKKGHEGLNPSTCEILGFRTGLYPP